MAKLSWAAEVLYRRLHSVVDDFGRFSAHPMLLRAACYPLQLDKVSDSDIGKWIRETEEAALVRVYPASDGMRYLELADFRQQKRAMKSKYPEPPSIDERPPSTCVADAQQPPASAHLDGGERREARNEGRAARKARETPIPEGFAVSEKVKTWAASKGFGSLDAHLEFFTGRMRASGKTYLDWDQAFENCVREDWAGIRTPKGKAAFIAPEPAKPVCPWVLEADPWPKNDERPWVHARRLL
jgi:hypothetical protein